MHKFIAILALAAAFVPSGLLAQQSQHRFSRDGVTYTYSVKADAAGRQVIQGRSQPGGSAFRLVVDGDLVEGVSGGRPVSFHAPAARAALVAAR